MRKRTAEAGRWIIGRSSTLGMQAARTLLARRAGRRAAALATTSELDRTGILVNRPVRLPVHWRDEEVIFPVYEQSLAHTLWRAQEFSLFMRHAPMLQKPVLDLGCGDGSFAAVLFDRIDFGVDIDQEALQVAREFGIYGQLIKSDGNSIELPDATIQSVFSNSVLEHVANLEGMVAEVSRILRPGGSFVFSVPVAQFARDLSRYFGKGESDRVNADYFHRNLLEIEQWKRMLLANGLSPATVRQYQPAWFSFNYMMLRYLGNRGLGRFLPDIRSRILRRNGRKLVDMVRRSINGEEGLGGNIFVVATKAGN